ncbi:CPBP family intramembrane metalloprotease [Plantibacter sp. MCCC 1A11337]|uniref:CPBP family intramembrane glutamic endopeptidase n=1 Tax=Plantibacter sp. MCCC 1A11337 TaxID=2736644 RepID=UPI00158268A9|nr:type II CAAX endopeptidase family protein [Plantibacter sp. MCCC 1A11337]NUJ88617.1 CPBP family intramembrane metalloprotease [Plantibacter sp. MCCC 1A11337]
MGEHRGHEHRRQRTLTTSGWHDFWAKGGIGRTFLLAIIYLALYLGAGWVVGQLFTSQIGEDLFATPQSVFFGLMLPLIVGSLILAGFVLSVGWFRELFAKQPIRGRWWMWAAPIVILAAVVLRLLGIDYGSYEGSVVVVAMLSGVFIGFAEEILTRGLVVKMLRDAGSSEWIVMVVSSLIFALLHASNLLSGQPLVTVLVTVVYTFGFGVCMYLTLRVTGNLIWPILVHGLYDPTLFLSTGGIDHAGAAAGQSMFLAIAGPANLLIMLVAVIGLIFVRGHVQAHPADDVLRP